VSWVGKIWHNDTVIGKRYSRTLIKDEVESITLPDSMEGFGMPQSFVDRIASSSKPDKRPSSDSVNVITGRTLDGKPAMLNHGSIDIVEIHYNNHVYQAPLRLFAEKGIVVDSPLGTQYVLPSKAFIKVSQREFDSI
jgi:hypothetical protein